MENREQEAIRQLAIEWVSTIQSEDRDRILAFFTDDVVTVGYSSRDVFIGLAQVRSLLDKQLGDTIPTNCSFEVDGIEVNGDWAELRGKFKTDWQPRREGGEIERESSRYIWVLKRQGDGEWKIVRFLFWPRG